MAGSADKHVVFRLVVAVIVVAVVHLHPVERERLTALTAASVLLLVQLLAPQCEPSAGAAAW